MTDSNTKTDSNSETDSDTKSDSNTKADSDTEPDNYADQTTGEQWGNRCGETEYQCEPGSITRDESSGSGRENSAEYLRKVTDKDVWKQAIYIVGCCRR